MPEPLSDQEIVTRFQARRRRQCRVLVAGFPGVMAWFAVSAVVFARLRASNPSWNSPWVFTALLAPFGVGFAVLAGRFTRRNLRCPVCDEEIALYGTRYYAREFDCPHCRRTLSR